MTLQQQYNLIKEGKGDRTNFLKNAKFQFPNLFNAYTSYEDSVNVLKSKGLISEGVSGAGGVVTGGREQDWVKIFKQNISEEAKAEEKKMSKEAQDMQSTSFDYKDLKNIDNVYGQSFLQGFYTEMQDPKNEDKTTNEVKAIVAKNLAKDRLYYAKDGMFGIKGLGYTTEAPGLGTPKEPKGKYKSSGYGDLREGLETRNYNEWKKELYNIIKKDNPGYTDGDIAVDDEELTKYFKNGKSAKEVYYDIWLQDAGNYANIGEGMYGSSDGDFDAQEDDKQMAYHYYDKGMEAYSEGDYLKADKYLTAARRLGSYLGWGDQELPDYDNPDGMTESDTENRFLKKGEKQTFKPIPASKSQAHTAGDKLRASTARYAKLKEAIREMILQELNEGAADEEVAKAEQEVADAKKKAADAKMKAAQAAQAEANAEEKA